MSSWACFFSGNCMLLQGFFVYFSKVCMFESPRSERVNGRGFCWYLSFSHFWPLAVWDLSCTHCLFMSISIKTCLRLVRCLLNCYTNDHNSKLFGPCVPRRDVSPIIEITELKKSKERNYWDKTELKKSKERMQTPEALVPREVCRECAGMCFWLYCKPTSSSSMDYCKIVSKSVEASLVRC